MNKASQPLPSSWIKLDLPNVLAIHRLCLLYFQPSKHVAASQTFIMTDKGDNDSGPAEKAKPMAVLRLDADQP